MWWWLVIVPVGFLLVVWNNKRNQNKLYNRKNRNFRENYMDKKKKEGKKHPSKKSVESK